MTSATPVTQAVVVSPASGRRVALVGVTRPSAVALIAALDAHPGVGGAWEVLTSIPQHEPSAVQIALCDDAADVRTARSEWPAADVVALVPARDDGKAAIAALHAGAHVCIRGDDPTLIAAYLHSIARRRGLIAEESAR